MGTSAVRGVTSGMKASKDMFLQLASYSYQGSCCGQLQVRSLSSNYPHRHCLGSFVEYLDVEGEPVVTYGASCFQRKSGQTYLYRTQHGNWCIGSMLGEAELGVCVKSNESDAERWAHSCPCSVTKWKRLEDECDQWVDDFDLSVTVHREKSHFQDLMKEILGH